MGLDVLGEASKLVSESIVIDKIVFERSPEVGEGASHVGIQRKESRQREAHLPKS